MAEKRTFQIRTINFEARLLTNDKTWKNHRESTDKNPQCSQTPYSRHYNPLVFNHLFEGTLKLAGLG